MDNYKILDILDKTLVEEESYEPTATRSPACWPSEASAELLDQSVHKVVGGCHRKAFYRMIGMPTGSHTLDPIGAWRFVIGRLIETHLTDLCKLATPPIWVANGVKLFVQDIGLSLEMDVITKDPKTNKGFIIECKTFYGNFAKRQFIGVYGKPKLEHVMQICMYLLEAKNGKNLKELIKGSLANRSELDASGKTHRNRCEADLSMVESMDDGSIGGKLVYLSRDEGDRIEFDISIEQESDGFHYPYVNGLNINAFTIESIYERYRTLQNYWFAAREEGVARLAAKGIQKPQKLNLINNLFDLQHQLPKEELTPEEELENKQYLAALEAQVRSLPDSFLPPAEFEFSYGAAKIEHLYKIGEIGKTKYNDWKSTTTGKATLNKDGSKSKRKAKPVPRIGDWQCLHPNTKVILEDGSLEKISLLKAGDVTSMGKVLKVMSKKVDRAMVNVKPYNLPWMQLTSDHLCLTGTFNTYIQKDFIPAGDLKKDEKYTLRVPFDTSEIYIDLTPNDLFIIGLWTAEGWYHHKRPSGGYYKVGFTIHPKEEMAVNNIKLFAKKFINRYGVEATVTDRTISDPRNGNTYRYLQINSKEAADFIQHWTVGNSAKSKRIKPELMKAPFSSQAQLLAGLLYGDGCITKMRNSEMNVYSTVSDQLAFDVQRILWRQNKVAGITKQVSKTGYLLGSKVNHVRWYNTTSERSWIQDGWFFTKIYKVKPLNYSEDVWDIEVEHTHVIPTESGVVHNCGYCPYRNTCIPKQNPALSHIVYDLQNSLDEETEVEFDSD